MPDQLSRAREAVQRAGDVADETTVREQLRSIDEGLREMTEGEGPIGGGPSTEGDEPHLDDLREVEEKLVGLVDETDGPARRRVQDARDAIDAYRRAHEEDW